MSEMNEVPKKKRGRRSKKDKTAPEIVKQPKKRGRKPKGGKIIQTPINIEPVEAPKPNIILHLRCGQSDLMQPYSFNNSVENYQLKDLKDNSLGYHLFNKAVNVVEVQQESDTNIESGTDNIKIIWKKLKELAINLHSNNISDKKSACHWCTYVFDSPPIYIPKCEVQGTYHVYGCFCSPECACAYLHRENLDTSAKFERYHFLNHIYCKIYNYEKNIKPAPDPYYTLERFYGNLTIQEYRRLLKNERLLLIVEKPLTRILPELHEDNDDFVINNKAIPSASKFPLRRKKNRQTKKDILNETFGTK